MFIELTDILRCPADHEEGVLVLLPDGVADRLVVSGQLGCMDCGRIYPVVEGVAQFGEAPAAATGNTRLTGAAMAAFLGLGGPGGFVALVGGAAAEWKALAAEQEGVHLVAVNSPDGMLAGRGVSVVRGGTIPIRSRQLRGVVLGAGFASDPHWIREARRVLLPGRHLVGESDTPPADGLEVMASADGVWVGKTQA